MLTFVFDGKCGKMEVSEKLISGAYGTQVQLLFSSEWDDLQKTAVFMALDGPISTACSTDVTQEILEIPAAVLANPEHTLYVQIQGFSPDGTEIINTGRVRGPKILPGIDAGELPEMDAKNPVWYEVLSQMGDLSELETASSQSLVSAINELALRKVEDGASAYEVALENGFEGTEAQWLESLSGKSAYEYALDAGYIGSEEEFASALMNSKDILLVVLAEDGNGGYSASKTYYEIAHARATGKLVLLQYGAFMTHILAGEPTEDCFLFEPLLHSVPGMPGYIVDKNDNWNSAPLTQEEEEPVFDNYIVVLEQDDSGNYTASASYFQIAEAREAGKLVLLQYGIFITHILAGEPAESSFLFEPLLHSVEGMSGYTVDIQDNWSAAPVTDTETGEEGSEIFTVTLEETGDGQYSASTTYMEIAHARASEKLVLLRYGLYITHILAGEPTESSYLFEPLLHSVEGIPGYIVDVQDNWSTASVSQSSSTAFVQLAPENESPVLGAELASADGWTSDGWTGDLASGFTHTSGNTNALSFSIPGIVTGKAYVIEFDCSVAYTNTNLLVTIGAAPAMLLYGMERTATKVGIIAVDTGALTFSPESAFAGKISNISIREIIGESTPMEAVMVSGGTTVSETRHAGESLFLGVGVGGKTVDGNGNFAIGDSTTFQNNISGFWNVAIGRKCMGANVSGSRNVSVGTNNLNANVAGTRNVAIGNYCMMQAQNPNRTVAIGGDCMSTATGGDNDVAIGFQALYKNTTGTKNVAIGDTAGFGNTTGSYNVAIGASSLNSNSTGTLNTALGYLAMYKDSAGKGNVAIGSSALKGASGASGMQYNTAIGYGALVNAESVSYTVAVGKDAGTSLTNGSYNIVIGNGCDLEDGSTWSLNIGNLLKGSWITGGRYLEVHGSLRLPAIGTTQTANSDVYSEEWTFTLSDGSAVTKKVLMV